jgi:glutathione S-transferase
MMFLPFSLGTDVRMARRGRSIVLSSVPERTSIAAKQGAEAAMNSSGRCLWGAGTSRTLRAHWALIELGLPYDSRPIGSRTGETQTPEFTAIAPRQKIPVLDDGGFILAESAAIATYLYTRYGSGPGSLADATPMVRARHDEWCFFVMTELDATTLYVIRRHGYLPETYGEAPAAISAAQDYFARQCAVVDETLADGRPFILGDTFGAADIVLTTCLDWALRYGLPLPPGAHDYLQRITARPGFVAAKAVNTR